MTLDFANFSVDDTRRINEIASEIKNDYTDFIDGCCKKYNNYLFWATPFASRNIYIDRTFVSLCKILYAVERKSKDKEIRIITDEKCELDVLAKVFKNRNGLSYRNHWQLKDSVNETMGRWKSIARFAIQKIRYIMCAPDYIYPDESAVVIGPVISNDFSENHFTDRYTTNIDKYGNVLFLSYPIHNDDTKYKDFLDRIKKCDNLNFLYDKKLCRYADLLEVVKYVLYIYRIIHNSFVYNGYDISSLVRFGLLATRYDSTAYEGLWMSRMLKRLSEQPLSVNKFIVWYEGRPADLLSCHSIRTHFEGVECLGYEGNPIQESNLSYFVSNYQYEAKYCPDKIAVISKLYEDDMRQFCPKIPLVFVPSLRNTYSIKMKYDTSGMRKRILIILSYQTEISKQMILMVNEYVKQCGNAFDIVIKNHPTNRNYTVADYGIEALSFEPQYVFGRLEECFDNVCIAITALTTSSLELICARIPLIILFPRGLIGYTALPEKEVKRLCRVVYDTDEMIMAINDSLHTEVDYSDLEGLVIERNDETIGRFFNDKIENKNEG